MRTLVSKIKKRQDPNRRHQCAFALVLVLAMLVLVATLVVAYFSRALQERRTGISSTAGTEAELLATSTVEIVLGDLLSEIEAGSEIETMGGIAVYQPILELDSDGETPPVAASMAPQRIVDHNPQHYPGVLKISRRGRAFFENSPGFDADQTPGPSRASAVDTGQASINGRSIPLETWNQPRLMTQEEFQGDGTAESGFASPDWIYVDRRGDTPDPGGADGIAALASPTLDNEDFVLGRFAYVIYDVGGLLDINVVGNALAEEANFHRGRLHQVDLEEGVGEIPWEDFAGFVDQWRWPDTANDSEALFEPRRTFLEVANGEQAFANRRELIRYAENEGSRIPIEVLPYLTTFSRALDAPHWRPDPERPKLPAEPDPDELNPDLLSVRFADEVVLQRGSDPTVALPAGTPVMPRRFPLAKLELFNENNPDPDALLYYFGLERVDGAVDTFEYVRATEDGRIARLHEVAAWRDPVTGYGREPNFFEVLQAAIVTGSLGKYAKNSVTMDRARDSLRNLQVLQIGANIIDQWDSDDIPTTMRYPSGEVDEMVEVYGIENLPYFHQFAYFPYRPPYDRDRMQLWVAFAVWNPHQNALAPPEGIEALRIVPIFGEFRNLHFVYMLDDFAIRVDGGLVGAYNESAEAELTHLNAGRNFEFPPFPGTSGYSEVTIVGGEAPETETDTPGILLWDHDLSFRPDGTPLPNPAVPPKGDDRHPQLQKGLNEFYDLLAPYTANHPTEDDPRISDSNENGEREYTADTTFAMNDTGQDFGTYWITETGAGGEIRLYAHYATKAHNRVRHLAPAHGGSLSEAEDWDPDWSPANPPLDFALQARVNGEWVTYQRIDGWFRRILGGGGRGISRYVQGTADPHTYFYDMATHHSELSEGQIADLPSSFYEWTQGHSYMGIDPRTTRFGFYDTQGRRLGLPLRSVTGHWRDNRMDEWAQFREVPGTLFDFEYNRYADPVYHQGRQAMAGLITNHPELETLNAYHPSRYRDRDGVIRPGDAYFGGDSGVVPTVPGRFADRPLILNRPFRSPADVGYVFRDVPWKTVDFASRYSGDLGLLDVFSLEESPEAVPLVAGKVNLNTRRPEVLAVLLRQTAERLDGIHEGVGPAQMTEETAQNIAAEVVAESSWRPFRYASDLIPRVFHRSEDEMLDGVMIKGEREAAARTLAGLGTTRTWNFMIDLVAQSGRFVPGSETAQDFLVTGERRYWVHVALDRLTGEVLELQKERVDE